jgi:preprotein translocase subunit SecA
MGLIEQIKADGVKTLHLIQLRDDRDVEEREEVLAKMVQDLEENATADMVLEHEDVLAPKMDKKVARNDPCPCGSGKKYKDCCGKSGPKKGLLADS